jgi:hypothetical protein
MHVVPAFFVCFSAVSSGFFLFLLFLQQQQQCNPSYIVQPINSDSPRDLKNVAREQDSQFFRQQRMLFLHFLASKLPEPRMNEKNKVENAIIEDCFAEPFSGLTKENLRQHLKHLQNEGQTSGYPGRIY